jgi:Fe-S cluster biosynthesis and repair protein YggX
VGAESASEPHPRTRRTRRHRPESSQAERRADDAERELMEWKKIKFMQDRVGEDFHATILSCTKYGFFVELDDLFIEGLVPIQTSLAAFGSEERFVFRDTDRAIVGTAPAASSSWASASTCCSTASTASSAACSSRWCHRRAAGRRRRKACANRRSRNAAHGFLHKVQGRDGRAGRAAVRLRLRPEDLQERLKKAWGEWVERQKMLLNEYRLQPWTREAQEFLVEQMNGFFFGEGEGGALPKEYVAPALALTGEAH